MTMIRRRTRNRRAHSSVDASYFDPATLPLTGWWQASYDGTGTWAAQPIGGGDLYQATTYPDAGTAVGGYTPADFNGSDDYLQTTSVTFADLFNVDAGTILALINPDTAAAAEANTYLDACIFKESGINMGMHFSDAGIKGAIYSGAWKFSPTGVALPTGSYALAAMTWDGTTMRVSVNGGAWDDVACGNVDAGALPNPLRMGGPPYGAGSWFDGKIPDIMTADSVLSGDDIANVIDYCNGRYGLSL